MKRSLLLLLFSVASMGLRAQTLTLVTPSGLEEPYEVPPSTSVTVRWTYPGSSPSAFFTYSAEPELDPYVVNPNWTRSTNYKDNGDGTFDFTIPVNSTVYLWGGARFDFTNMWQYSNVIKITALSNVKITATDGYLCTGNDTETLTVTGTYPSYRWYRNDQPIANAASATYTATEPGLYKVQANNVFSNTIRVKTADVTFTGSLSGNALSLTAAAGVTSYQWLSGSSPSALTPITNATNANYTATLTGTTVYYAVRAVRAGCTVQSEARPASTAFFAKPVIAYTPPAGTLCDGTGVTLKAPDTYASYFWAKDNGDFLEGGAEFTVYSGAGNYKVAVTRAEWPEITITSDPKRVNYYTVIEPVVTLTGGTDGSFCPGNTAKLTLVDEGLEYVWYRYTDGSYTEADNLHIPEGQYEYSFTVDGSEYITIVAKDAGCESVKSVYVRSFASNSLYLELSDYSQTYLCQGKSVDAFVSEGDAQNYASYQWYELLDNAYVKISGETGSRYTISNAGTYRVEAISNGCSGAKVVSEPVVILPNTARELTITADQTEFCVGEKATLTVSSEWTAVQWLEKKITMGATHGYDITYVPISGAGTANTLTVSNFNGYVVKARHVDCNSGVKVTSQELALKPRVNPTIGVDPDHEISRWRKMPYDSAASYIYCNEAPLTMTLPQGYDSYKWYKLAYNGDDKYALGDPMENATGTRLDVTAWGAIWYTAMVEKDGCVGLSDPVLIDTYVHASPAISSDSNNELCAPGDSVRMNSAFISDGWVRYEWFKDGELLPDSDNDTLYAKEPGGYILTAYPKECPQFGYSTGIPVQVRYMEKAVIHENDTMIWATPWQGYYTYQWYLNGQPVANTGEYPYMFKKTAMKSGEYTISVTNPNKCGREADPFTWVIMGNEEARDGSFTVYPNPTDGSFTINGLDERTIRAVTIYTAHGLPVQHLSDAGTLGLTLAAQVPGVYIIEVVLKDGSTRKAKVIRS